MGAKLEGLTSSSLRLLLAYVGQRKKQRVVQGTTGVHNPFGYIRSHESGNLNQVGHRAVNCVVWLECIARKLEEVDVRFRTV